MFAFALAHGAAAQQARAAEAYLCGPDKIVYVAANDLELKKRTDPCIAAYYGLTVAAAAPVKAAATFAAPSPPTKKAQRAAAKLKRLNDTEAATSALPPSVRQATLAAPATTASGTDFRMIKVLNATSPDGAWFHHEK